MRLNSKNRKPRSRKAFACLCLAGGLLFLGMVFGLSRYSDMQSCEHRMNELIDFVKEQSSAYVQYNETAVAKALVRGTTAMQELDGLTLDCGEDALRQYTERLWLTGVSVVDAKGRLVCEYSTDGIGYAQLQTDLEPERVLAVIGHPQSTYVRRAQRGGERRKPEQQQVPFRYHEIGKRHQRQRDRREGVHRREQVAELRQDEGDDDDDDGDREDGEDHRIHERGFDLLIHLMRLFIVDGEPLRDPVEPAAALARADHAEHERREHLLRLERVGQARALAHLAQHALVHAAQTGADALVLGNDRERAHQTDARGEQRGKLAAQVAELLRTERARAAVCAAAGDALRVQSLLEQLRVQRVIVRRLHRAADGPSVDILCRVAEQRVSAGRTAVVGYSHADPPFH